MNAAQPGRTCSAAASQVPGGDPIDREVGDLIARPAGIAQLFTYLRYDADVSRAGLDALGLRDVKPEHVQLMDSVEHVDEIARVGRRWPDQVRRDHFAAFLKA